LDTQLYKVLQINCEPYPPIPRTPGDLRRIVRFRVNGSQNPWLGGGPDGNNSGPGKADPLFPLERYNLIHLRTIGNGDLYL